jgi:NADH-quinone oxidoreductase subunit G
MSNISIKINEIEYSVESGMTVIDACERYAGVQIPRFCYHKELKIAGNCRMCLVEIKPGPPKPMPSCQMLVAEGMSINTESEMVKKAREGVMEFILANHPLDCPICDQGGECDLQDQAYIYGKDKSRYNEDKRVVEDKDMGPLIKTNMTRCIHCTRCIRFSEDIAGVNDLGAVGRGEDMEIVAVEGIINSNLSGNVIDLCPVGALTSKPYAFKARSWELQSNQSIDVMDAIGSSINVQTRGDEVMRILPSNNPDINKEWISDKARFSYDGLKNQRLDSAYIRRDGKIVESSVDDAISAFISLTKGVSKNEIAFISGRFCDIETLFLAKKLASHFGSSLCESRVDSQNLDIEKRGNYLFNSGIKNVETSDAILLVGTNPKNEAPVLNSFILKAQRNGAKIYSINPELNLGYKAINLGSNISALEDIFKGNNISDVFKNAKKPMIIIGEDAISNENGKYIHQLAISCANKYFMRDGCNGFNFLHKSASSVGSLDIDFISDKGIDDIIKNYENGNIKILFVLGSDELKIKKNDNCKIVYLGTHGDIIANFADIILPGATYVEKYALYANTEGVIQSTKKCISNIGDSMHDCDILLKIMHELGLKDYNCRQDVVDAVSVFYDKLDNKTSDFIVFKIQNLKYDIKLDDENYYMTDSISRLSPTMSECVKQIKL